MYVHELNVRFHHFRRFFRCFHRDNVDKTIVAKYVFTALGVLVGTVGKQKAAEILDEILNKAQANLQQNDCPLPDRMVLLDTRTGRVEVGHQCGWGHLADRPHFVDITRRLSDINIYRSIHPDDPHRLRCKVDGVQQMARSMNMLECKEYETLQQAGDNEALKAFKVKMAESYFPDTLSVGVEPSRGVRR